MLGYLLNVASGIRPYTNDAREFANSLREIMDELEIEIPKLGKNDLDMTAREARDHDDSLSARDWLKIRNALEREARRSKRQKPDDLAQRIQALAALIGLNKTDIALLKRYSLKWCLEARRVFPSSC